MHPSALDFVSRETSDRAWDSVLELGSYDVNGTARDVITARRYHGIDVRPGPGVDEVFDARLYRDYSPYDLVICTEVLEHVPEWWMIVKTALWCTSEGSRIIITAACDPRGPHSWPGGEDEWYRNIDPDDLWEQVESDAWASIMEVDDIEGDVRVRVQR